MADVSPETPEPLPYQAALPEGMRALNGVHANQLDNDTMSWVRVDTVCVLDSAIPNPNSDYIPSQQLQAVVIPEGSDGAYAIVHTDASRAHATPRTAVVFLPANGTLSRFVGEVDAERGLSVETPDQPDGAFSVLLREDSVEVALGPEGRVTVLSSDRPSDAPEGLSVARVMDHAVKVAKGEEWYVVRLDQEWVLHAEQYASLTLPHAGEHGVPPEDQLEAEMRLHDEVADEAERDIIDGILRAIHHNRNGGGMQLLANLTSPEDGVDPGLADEDGFMKIGPSTGRYTRLSLTTGEQPPELGYSPYVHAWEVLAGDRRGYMRAQNALRRVMALTNARLVRDDRPDDPQYILRGTYHGDDFYLRITDDVSQREFRELMLGAEISGPDFGMLRGLSSRDFKLLERAGISPLEAQEMYRNSTLSHDNVSEVIERRNSQNRDLG
jgi:hypothetical protein